MAKPEWGIKRTCTGCGARFYDLCRDPIICPKCETTIDPVAMLRSQRSKAPAPAPVVAKKPVPVADDADDPDVADGDDLDDDISLDDDAADTADTGDDVLEDTSELGEDKDDMFEVIDKVADEGGEEEAR